MAHRKKRYLVLFIEDKPIPGWGFSLTEKYVAVSDDARPLSYEKVVFGPVKRRSRAVLEARTLNRRLKVTRQVMES